MFLNFMSQLNMKIYLHLTFVQCLFVGLLAAENDCEEVDEYDYIVVGSGSTGAVVAARLSEDPGISVILLEAGGIPPEVPSEVPLISFKALNSEIDWKYFSERQQTCCSSYKNEKVPLNRGKALGGTSSINFMTYTRGNKKDFDLWESFGNPGWSYKDVFKYFLKLEDYQVPRTRADDPYHSQGGPITVEIPTFKSQMADTFLQAGFELDQPLVDYNAEHQTGFMYPPVTIRNGGRCGTYIGYLKPIMDHRDNLNVVINALVTKIIIDKDLTATGVMYEKKKKKCQVKAKKEVIIRAGAYNTPQLLMLSGIGPKKHLEKLKIPVIKDLHGVGANLQDHVVVGAQMYYINQSITYNGVRYETDKYLKLWKKTRTGPMTCPESFEGVAYYQTKYVNDSDDWPDIEIFFNSDNTVKFVKPLLKKLIAAFVPPDDRELISFLPVLLRPKSRGTVRLKSKSPHDPPLIDPKYLSNPHDVDVLVEGLHFSRDLANTKAFQQYGAKLFNFKVDPFCALEVLDKEDYDKCFVRSVASTGYHPSSTCKMGPKDDSMAVVDHELRVHGIQSLRIADASIMPTIVSAHPNIACIMIGEKLADMIQNEEKNKQQLN